MMTVVYINTDNVYKMVALNVGESILALQYIADII